MGPVDWSVFTKPWPRLGADSLGRHVAALGFDGVELPVRPGFPVTPENASRALPEAVRKMADHGVHTFSIAAEPDEPLLSACAEAGVPTVRIMVPVGSGGYLAAETAARDRLERLVPLCERYRVRIGVQQHHGRYISTSAGIRRLLEGLPARYVCAVWDAGHDALAGEDPDLGLAQVWSHLGMVNLKNAFYRRTSDGWRPHFVDGPSGLARWPQVCRYLSEHDYTGTVCLTAQYTDAGDAIDRLIDADLRYAKSLFR